MKDGLRRDGTRYHQLRGTFLELAQLSKQNFLALRTFLHSFRRKDCICTNQPNDYGPNPSEYAVQIEASLIKLKTNPRSESYPCTGDLAVKNPNYGARIIQSILAYWTPDTVRSPHSNTYALQVCPEWRGDTLRWHPIGELIIRSTVLPTSWDQQKKTLQAA